MKILEKKIINKEVKIAVVGLGYVGLPLAISFVKSGLAVAGIEIDRGRLAYLKEGKSYITDISDQDVKQALRSKRFRVRGDFRAVKDCGVILICVPTPLKRKYQPDISYIKKAVKAIARNLSRGTLVILESTTYPGTTEEVILPLLQRRNLKHGKDFYLCFSPERIDPGNRAYPVDKIPKIVGGVTPEATNLAALVYKNIIDRVIPVSSARTAEAAKLLENTFRLINIALIDELAMMAHNMKIDIWEVVEAAKTKPFGFMPFYPSSGCGGHCIPKDPLYLFWKAKHHGFHSRFIRLASDIISIMPVYVAERVISLLNKEGRRRQINRVMIIGVTYKKDVKDLRKSPSLDLIDAFQKKNVEVSYYDPLIPYLRVNHINLKSVKLTKEGLRKSDCVVIATDHSGINYSFIRKNSRLIFDTRNVYREIQDKKIFKL